MANITFKDIKLVGEITREPDHDHCEKELHTITLSSMPPAEWEDLFCRDWTEHTYELGYTSKKAYFNEGMLVIRCYRVEDTADLYARVEDTIARTNDAYRRRRTV